MLKMFKKLADGEESKNSSAWKVTAADVLEKTKEAIDQYMLNVEPLMKQTMKK